jgi:lipid II:glycine glycyltransferase (peptidoglycan interpeptide bridge formation enzyme)
MGDSVTRLVLVETSQGKPIAGAFVLCGGEIAHYHLGGSDFAHQNDRPNDLLYLAMAQTTRAAGCAFIAWGGGLSTDPADSLFRFKCGFGRDRMPAHIGCRVLNEPAYRSLIEAWERRNPDRAATCKMFLRYRA